jgi:hypothetical protein
MLLCWFGGTPPAALLLGAARDQLGDGPLVIVPPGRLNAVPWGLLPSLAGRSATAARVLAAIDGTGLAHIAAHGTFRADSPMFSSLRLADGPMTVHDVERLRRAPFRLILPAASPACSPRRAPATRW